jgi:hypothetical protein
VALHAECGFTRRVWLYTQSVVSTHKRLILTRMRVNDTHECDNDTIECNFYMQSVISTRIVILTRTHDVISTPTIVISIFYLRFWSRSALGIIFDILVSFRECVTNYLRHHLTCLLNIEYYPLAVRQVWTSDCQVCTALHPR